MFPIDGGVASDDEEEEENDDSLEFGLFLDFFLKKRYVVFKFVFFSTNFVFTFNNL